MGNCVPVGKNTDSALKLKCSIKSEGNGFLIESPVKDTIVSDDRSMMALNSNPQSSSRKPRESSFRDMSNREMYFDSQLWLESDSEDYESINGDFTTSQGTSPTRPCSTLVENAPQDESFPINTTANAIIPEACPAETKKQLIELFSESFKGETVDENTNSQEAAVSKPTVVNLPPTCSNVSPYESAGNSFPRSKTTPNSGKEKSGYSAQRCLPNLGRSLSFGERKRKLSPGYICGK